MPSNALIKVVNQFITVDEIYQNQENLEQFEFTSVVNEDIILPEIENNAEYRFNDLIISFLFTKRFSFNFLYSMTFSNYFSDLNKGYLKNFLIE